MEPGSHGKVRVYPIVGTKIDNFGEVETRWCAEALYRPMVGRTRPVRRHGLTKNEALTRLNQVLNPNWIEGVRIPQSSTEVCETAARAATPGRGVRHVLYRFFDHENVLLYVGITKRIYARSDAHRAQPWWDEVVRIEIEDYPDREATREAELAAIRTENPKYNIADVIKVEGIVGVENHEECSRLSASTTDQPRQSASNYADSD